MKSTVCGLMVLVAGSICAIEPVTIPNPVIKEKIYDPKRPYPKVVAPKPAGELAAFAKAPEGAVVLFDGTGFDHWAGLGNGNVFAVKQELFTDDWLDKAAKEPRWKTVDGAMEVTRTSHLVTKESFGDIQLHLEWRVSGKDQGNSGVYIMTRYELAILDSYENRIKKGADRSCGAIFGQYPPLVNACRPPGEWQSYDVTWTRPRFNAKGELIKAATMKVYHNGILIQDEKPLTGSTKYPGRPPYRAHGKLPLLLQCHGDAVQFRNIWVVDLEKEEDSNRRKGRDGE